MTIAIQARPALQPLDMQPLGQLIVNFEIREIATRIAAAVMHFFQAIANLFQSMGKFLAQGCSSKQTILPITMPPRPAEPVTLEERTRAVIADMNQIPAPEKEAMLAHVLPLITEGMSQWEKKQVIGKVAEAPAQEREALVRLAHLFITPQMDVWDIRRLLHDVIAVPAQEREAVIPLVRQLTNNRWEITDFLQAIRAIPAEERGVVIAQALLLITEGMNRFDKEDLIQAVVRIRANEREAIVALALPVITEEMGVWGRQGIINELIDIAPGQRADVMRHAQDLINPQMGIMARRDTIRYIARQPADERADFVRNRRMGIQPPPRQDREQVLNDYARGLNVHNNNRDRLTLDAIARLCGYQGAIPAIRITQAQNEFTAYLNDSPAFNARQKQSARDSMRYLGHGEFDPRNGVHVTGNELIGRLWIYVCQLDDPRDITNAKDGMISALEDGRDACPIGQAQRLIVATLQGRLREVNIEGDIVPQQVTRQDAMNMFFAIAAHQTLDTLNGLLEAANRFCHENPGVNRANLLEDVNLYAAVGEIR